MHRPSSAVDPEGTSTHASVLGPGVAFADYVRATSHDPQPGARTLQALREAAFSGEIRFETVPAIAVYADHGVVYHAERAGDPTISERLLDEGVVTRVQLNRGTIVVGGQEHLGRMFDRDPSINRIAVTASATTRTNAVVAEIESLPTVAAVATQYRHHPSGIHRWFVGPAGVSLQRPVSDVAQVDRSVIEDLPEVIDPAPKIRIEWYEPDPYGDFRRTSTVDRGSVDERHADLDDRPERVRDDGMAAEIADAVSVHPAQFDADETDRGPGFEPFRDRRREPDPYAPLIERRASPRPVAPAAHVGVDDDDFSVIWPDGTRERASADATPTPPEPTPPEPSAAASTSAKSAPSHSAVRGDDEPAIDPATEPAAPGSKAEDVPEEVADAVRRALEAIEEASSDDEVVSPRRIVVPPPPPPPADVTIATAPAANGFAPPTSDMRAEAVYARAAAAAEWDAEPETDAALFAPSPPTGDDEHGERRGALRRLIDNLRRPS